MNNSRPSLRFDHREIAVIFSLFIFVSLLMFTVGILVGKGIAQAKYEAVLLHEMGRNTSVRHAEASSGDDADADAQSGQEPESAREAASVTDKKTATGSLARAESATAPADEESPKKVASAEPKPLQLVPKGPPPVGRLAEGASASADQLLKDPKIRALVEDEAPRSQGRVLAGIVPMPERPVTPPSFKNGKFTVQVGSYPTQKDASERVEALRKLGFPYAYFSAKELGDQKETWFRVWLGYYPDFDSAKKSGEILQQRGEVKNYLVRKTDTAT